METPEVVALDLRSKHVERMLEELRGPIDEARRYGLDTSGVVVGGWIAGGVLHGEKWCPASKGKKRAKEVELARAWSIGCPTCSELLVTGQWELEGYSDACRQVLELVSEMSSDDMRTQDRAFGTLKRPGTRFGPGGIEYGIDQEISSWLEQIRERSERVIRTSAVALASDGRLLAECAAVLLPDPVTGAFARGHAEGVQGALETARRLMVEDPRWVLVTYNTNGIEAGTTAALILRAWHVRGHLGHMPRVAFEALAVLEPSAAVDSAKLARQASPEVIEAVAVLSEADGVYSKLTRVLRAAVALG